MMTIQVALIASASLNLVLYGLFAYSYLQWRRLRETLVSTEMISAARATGRDRWKAEYESLRRRFDDLKSRALVRDAKGRIKKAADVLK